MRRRTVSGLECTARKQRWASSFFVSPQIVNPQILSPQKIIGPTNRKKIYGQQIANLQIASFAEVLQIKQI